MICYSEATLCGKKAIALSFPFYTRDYTSSQIQNACSMGKIIKQKKLIKITYIIK